MKHEYDRRYSGYYASAYGKKFVKIAEFLTDNGFTVKPNPRVSSHGLYTTVDMLAVQNRRDSILSRRKKIAVVFRNGYLSSDSLLGLYFAKAARKYAVGDGWFNDLEKSAEEEDITLLSTADLNEKTLEDML